MPRFSIIVPVYNVAEYVGQCLESVLGQGFGDWEAVCVDDGSTDGGGAMLDGYARRDGRVRVVHRRNGGLSAARNTGLEAATGEYVLFLDGDDWLEEGALAAIDAALEGEDMLCFACRRTDSGLADTMADELTDGRSYFARHALEGRTVPFVCVWQRCYRRGFLEGEGLRFREGILHEDNLFTPLACMAAGRLRVVGTVAYNYRIRPGSIMTTRGLRSRESLVQVANELAARMAGLGGDAGATARRLVTQCYQMAFAGGSRADDRGLRRMVDWRLYRAVSRTSLRHRVNYALVRLSPSVYRRVNRMAQG